MDCPEDKHDLIKKALRLEYVLIGYNIIEAVISVGAGIMAGSIALVGFGLDSVIEVTSAATLVWRLKSHKHADDAHESRVEKRALKVVGFTFFALAVYISVESVKTLWRHEAPSESMVGIIVASLSLLIMPYLGIMKKRIAIKINSPALEADAMETIICSVLSAILLAGLGLNALFGWWWADPVAGLVMVVFIVKEGWEAFEKAGEKNSEAEVDHEGS